MRTMTLKTFGGSDCPLCEEPPDGFGLVILFTGYRHVYKGCQLCEVAYCQLKEFEDERKEEKESG